MLIMEIKELNISEELKRKIDMVCRFTFATPRYRNGKIKSIKGTNKEEKLFEFANIQKNYEKEEKDYDI